MIMMKGKSALSRSALKTTGARAYSTTNLDLKEKSPPVWNKFPDGSRFWKNVGGGKLQRPIFVAATRQHVGKTTTSLAIMSGLQKRFDKVGFIKPVGQVKSFECVKLVCQGVIAVYLVNSQYLVILATRPRSLRQSQRRDSS